MVDFFFFFLFASYLDPFIYAWVFVLKMLSSLESSISVLGEKGQKRVDGNQIGGISLSLLK